MSVVNSVKLQYCGFFFIFKRVFAIICLFFLAKAYFFDNFILLLCVCLIIVVVIIAVLEFAVSNIISKLNNHVAIIVEPLDASG